MADGSTDVEQYGGDVFLLGNTEDSRVTPTARQGLVLHDQT